MYTAWVRQGLNVVTHSCQENQCCHEDKNSSQKHAATIFVNCEVCEWATQHVRLPTWWHKHILPVDNWFTTVVQTASQKNYKSVNEKWQCANSILKLQWIKISLHHVLSFPSTVPPNSPSTIISGTYMALLIYLQQYWYRNYIQWNLDLSFPQRSFSRMYSSPFLVPNEVPYK